MRRHAPCLASLVFPRAELSGRICLGFYGRGDPADADGPLIRIVGDARFAKVAVHRGRFDPAAPWQHWMQQEAAAR